MADIFYAQVGNSYVAGVNPSAIRKIVQDVFPPETSIVPVAEEDIPEGFSDSLLLLQKDTVWRRTQGTYMLFRNQNDPSLQRFRELEGL